MGLTPRRWMEVRLAIWPRRFAGKAGWQEHAGDRQFMQPIGLSAKMNRRAAKSEGLETDQHAALRPKPFFFPFVILCKSLPPNSQ